MNPTEEPIGTKHVGADQSYYIVRFLRLAYAAARRALAPYSSKFSKRTFTQPQIEACALLGRYLGMSFRELVGLLSSDPCYLRAIGARGVPRRSTISAYVNRADDAQSKRILLTVLRADPRLRERLPPAEDFLDRPWKHATMWLPQEETERRPGILAFPSWWGGQWRRTPVVVLRRSTRAAPR